MFTKPALAAIVLASLGAVALALWLGGPRSSLGERQPMSSVFEPSEEFQFDPPRPGTYALHRIKTAPNGNVLDIDGKARTLSEITLGKISLVSFVYLNCGDINGCPLAMATLFDIHDASMLVPELRDKVQLVTLSFDPERDTVEAIEAFAYPVISDVNADKKLEWHVLTTSGQAELQPILNGYGQAVDRSKDQENISHLLRIFLVDGAGQIRNIYGLGLIDPRLLMTDVETLMMEEGLI